MGFFIVPTAELKVLFLLVILGHDRRRVLHFNVTEHPTAANCMPWGLKKS
jgi:hypothetical protein